MIGMLGDTVFEASTERVFTFRGMARTGSPRLQEHAIVGRKPALEFIGPGLDEVSFSIRLDTFLGVAPEEELKRLREARDEGQVLTLTIGGDYLGRWVIVSAEEAHTRHNGEGRLVVADVALTLREVADEPA